MLNNFVYFVVVRILNYAYCLERCTFYVLAGTLRLTYITSVGKYGPMRFLYNNTYYDNYIKLVLLVHYCHVPSWKGMLPEHVTRVI